MVRYPLCSVADCWDGEHWGMEFKRCLSVEEYNSWLNLLDMLKDCALTDNKADRVLWNLDMKNQFSTKSLYRFCTDRGVHSKVAGHLWKSKVPLKIKFFLCQVLNNKLQVAENLVKKRWKGGISCCLCGEIESIDHIFFDCHLAKLGWGIIKEVFSLTDYPRSMEEL